MENDAPGAQDEARRRPDGTFAERPPGASPLWQKGQSGNPSGRPKGFQDITRRIQNFYGAEANWPMVKRLLDRALSEESEVDVGLRALNMGLSNSQTLLKADSEPLEDAPPPVVQLEDGTEVEE